MVSPPENSFWKTSFFFRIEYRLASYHFDAFVCFTSLGCRQVDACQAERPSFLPEVWSTRPVKDRMVNLNWMVIFCGSCFVGVCFFRCDFCCFCFCWFWLLGLLLLLFFLAFLPCVYCFVAIGASLSLGTSSGYQPHYGFLWYFDVLGSRGALRSPPPTLLQRCEICSACHEKRKFLRPHCAAPQAIQNLHYFACNNSCVS